MGGYGFIYDHGVLTPIAYPGFGDTTVYDINDFGQLVGVYVDLTVPGGQEVGFFRDTNGAYHTFNGSIGSSFQPVGVNNSGEIVGTYGRTGSGDALAAPYSNGTFTTLPVPGLNPGVDNVIGINNTRQILVRAGSFSQPLGFYAVLDPNGTLTPLDLNFPSTWVYEGLGVINDAGQIVGFADTRIRGPTFGFIASPAVPESASFGLGALGFSAVSVIAWTRRRRCSSS